MESLKRTPDRLLKQTEEARTGRGKLKIFFGYAAGIGKTYAMLSFAQMESASGTDIVAGYIEPHGRPETMELMRGLEQIPARVIKEKGAERREFDLDAALRRRPAMILVDEMAHANAPLCRHRKRYEDIEELLNAGIDVCTTVNVQHIESLHDSVAALAGAAVGERIPDAAFDEADQVEMVDLTPQELIARLEQGRIYPLEKAPPALRHFFTMENLTALREIALRRMADWVNAAQDLAGGRSGRGNASEHIMMCLSPSPSNQKVIRQAARMAAAFHGKFTAFYVETPAYSDMGREDLERLRSNTKLAEQLGARAITSYGNDIVEQIAEYAKVARVTKIVLGRTYTRRSLLSVKESFSNRLAKSAPNLEIFLIPDSYDKRYKKERRRIPLSPLHATTDAGVVALMLSAATAIAFVFEWAGFSESNRIMAYMLGVLGAALLTRYPLSGIIYGFFSILAFNFFFTEPKWTLNVNDPGYVITFMVMLATSAIISTLVRQVREAARQSAKKSYRTEILLQTSQKLQQATNAGEIAEKTVSQLGKLLGCNIYCYLGSPKPEKKPFSYLISEERREQLPKEEVAVAEWTFKNNKHAGATTTTLPGARCLYLTIRNGDKIFAVVGVELHKKTIPSFEEGIMLAILNESALAFEKEEMVRKERETGVRLEQEQLRANLLRSISHDLRTPLTSISGNADMLMENSDGMEEARKREIYRDIYDDSLWLINLVENLLSVTRIENGTMQLNIQPELVDDVVSEAVKHISRKASEHEVTVLQEDDMLVARMDAKLIIQVLINLIDNAVKYTPRDSKIELRTRGQDGAVIFEVSDDGPGIPKEQQEKIFTMFYTGGQNVADGRRGMGLGLPLCKSIVEAHGGTIRVEEQKPRGTRFIFTLKAEEVVLT